MGDIKNPKLLWLKGILFLVLGLFASALLLMFAPDLTVAFLLGVSIWSFCRAYYFAFYVIEHYVDPSFRFAGLLDFLKYAVSRRNDSSEDL